MHLVGALLESRISVIDIYETCARAAESLLDSFKMHRNIPYTLLIPSYSHIYTSTRFPYTCTWIFKILPLMCLKKLKSSFIRQSLKTISYLHFYLSIYFGEDDLNVLCFSLIFIVYVLLLIVILLNAHSCVVKKT